MIRHRFVFFLIICAFSTCYVQSTDLSYLIPPCSISRLIQVLPRNVDVTVYFNDRNPDGSYVFGYILSSGERRYESGTLYGGILYVQGLYSFRRLVNSRYVYETTRYTAGKDGYYPSRVEVTYQPPKIPTVDY